MPRHLAAAAAAVTAALVSSATPAAADGLYVGMGMGVSRYGAELADRLGDDTGVHLRAAVGHRWGHLALEVYALADLPIGGSYQYAEGNRPTVGSFDALTALGVDLKVIQPLSTHWSSYVRAGLSRMSVNDHDYSGRGVGATAGIQVAGNVRALGYLWWPLFFFGVGPKVHSALWFEASTSFHRLHGERGRSIDATITGWTLGFSVGQDF